MADPLTVTASVVGIVVPALHGARLLIDDLEKISDAPRVVKGLELDLALVSSSLESLKAIEEPQWGLLGSRILDQSNVAVGACVSACDAMRGDLQRWTRRSRDGKLSWRDKASIGFFKERRVKAMSGQLQSCKLTLSYVVGVATFYSSLQNTSITEAIKEELAERRADMKVTVQTTDRQIALAQQSLAELHLTDEQGQSEQDGEDADTALLAVEAEIATLQSAQQAMGELMSKMQAEKVEQAVSHQQTGAIIASFGQNNRGFQLASNSGHISGVSIG